MKTEHTPTRCKLCKWIHEADSVKNTSYQGVEFCEKHNRAVNSYEELIKIAQAYRNLLRTMAHTEGEVATYHHIESILAQAEGK